MGKGRIVRRAGAACPRCGGNIISSRYENEAWICLQCGNVEYVKPPQRGGSRLGRKRGGRRNKYS